MVMPKTWFWLENIPAWMAFIWKLLVIEIRFKIIVGIQTFFWNVFITWNIFLNKHKTYCWYKCNWKLTWDWNSRAHTPWLLFFDVEHKFSQVNYSITNNMERNYVIIIAETWKSSDVTVLKIRAGHQSMTRQKCLVTHWNWNFT